MNTMPNTYAMKSDFGIHRTSPKYSTVSTAAKLDEDDDILEQPNIMGVPMSRRLDSIATEGRESVVGDGRQSIRSNRSRKRTM